MMEVYFSLSGGKEDNKLHSVNSNQVRSQKKLSGHRGRERIWSIYLLCDNDCKIVSHVLLEHP